jgi:Dolichyl-phosphate-mannose-protein mannosyltransferase
VARGLSERLRFRPDLSTAVVVAFVAAFVVVAGLHIRVPGLYYDEVFQETTALAFVKGGLASQPAIVPGSEISILGHPLPVMANSYIGAVKTIAFSPVAAAFGISPASVRFFTIVVAALALLAYARFLRILFPEEAVAVLATALLASDPSYVFFSRVDFGPSVFMFLLKGVALWQLALWWRTGRLRPFVIGSFALGLGVYDKVNFLWIVAAIPLAALCVRPREVRARVNRRLWAIGGGSFVLGCLPLVAYNLAWPPRTLDPVLHGSLHIAGGNQAGGPLTQLHERFQQLTDLLDGKTIVGLLGDLGGPPPILPILCALAAAAILVASLDRRARPRLVAERFVVFAGLLVLLFSALTPGGSYAHHVLLTYPFPHVALAAAAVAAYRLLRGRAAALAVGSVATAAIVAAVALGVRTDSKLLSRLSATGGSGNFSDAIYGLEDYLAKDESRPFVAVDWGIYQNLVALSQGRLRGHERWLELSQQANPGERYAGDLTSPTTAYLLHTPGWTNFPRARRKFFRIVRASGRHARLVRVIPSRQGHAVFEVYRVS